MRKVLISSFDMEVGGVERSLIGMLNNFDYVAIDKQNGNGNVLQYNLLEIDGTVPATVGTSVQITILLFR